MYPLFVSEFNGTWTSSADFSENTQTWNFMKIHPLWTEWFHADGPPDMMKLKVVFRNFVKAPKKSPRCIYRALLDKDNAHDASFWPFHMTADGTALAAIPFRRE